MSHKMMTLSSIPPITPANMAGLMYQPQSTAQLPSQGPQQLFGNQAAFIFHQQQPMFTSQDQYMRFQQPFLSTHQVQTQPVMSQQGSVSFHQGIY